jgi:hypothetical protein
MAAEFEINRLRFTWAGPWTASTFYNRDAVVSYNGKTYVCLVPNTSSNNFNADLNFITSGGASTPYWQVVVDGRVWKQAWAPSTYYFTGNIVTYGGTVYNCITQHTSTTSFDATKWTTISQSSAWRTNWAINTPYGLGDIVKYGGIVYQCNTIHTSASTTVLGLENLGVDLPKWTIINKGLDYKGAWVSNARYKAQDIVKVGSDLYLSTVGHSAMTFNSSSEWTLWVPGIQYAGTWNSSTVYQTGDTASYGGYSYVSATQNNTNNIPSVEADDWVLLTFGYTIGGAWTNGLPAKIGTIVTRGGRLYVAIADNLSEDPTAISLPTTYTASGSSGTTVKVASTAGVQPGMNVIGVGFTLGQTVSRKIDSTTVVLDRGPDGAVNNAQTITFVGVNYSYWQLVVPGSTWNNRWTLGTEYTIGNLVVWKNGTYNCIQKHSASSGNRPDADTTNQYWTLQIAHHRKNASTTTGDIEIYNGTTGNYDVLPIGTNSYTLRSTTGNPAWSHLNAINAVYYVAPTGTDSDTSGWGQTWDKPWKSIKFACDYIGSGIYYPSAKTVLTNAKEWLAQEVYNVCLYNKNNNIAPFTSSSVFDATKTVRDVRLIVDAVIYDLTRGGNSQTVAATLSYFKTGSPDQLLNAGITSQITYFVSAYTYLRTLIISNALTGNPPAQNYQVLNGQSSVVTQPALGGGGVEAQAVVDTTTLLTILINALTTVNTTKIPAANYGATATVMVKTGTYSETLPIVVPANVAINGDELRGAVVQPATIYNGIIKATTIVDTVGTGISSQTLSTITALSTNNMVIGEPIQFGTTTGNISAFTTYYIHGIWSSTKFSIKTTAAGNTALTLTTTALGLSIVAYGGQALKDMFRLRNGSGLRNMTVTGLLGFIGPVNANGTQRPTGGSFACLDPGTGANDTTTWIVRRSPYVQNVTTFGYGCTGLKIDGTLHNGGNKSIVANDFTQIISNGIGVWCTGTGSLTEIVSVFSYYAYCGYYAENGGRMRATNGNTSYGSYGVIAEGFDETEVPIAGKVYNQSSQVQANVQSSFGSNAQLLKVLYGNSGSHYNRTTTNMLSYSNAFTNADWLSAADGNVTLSKNTSAPIGTAVDGWSLTGATAITGENYIAQNITIGQAGAFYSNLGAVNISGSGSSATFDITVTSTVYLVSVNTGGSGYVGGGVGAGNQLYIAGSQLGGVDSVNDCIITVDTLAGSSILTVIVSGTVPAGSALSYTASLYVKKGTAVSVDLQAIFSGSSTRTSQLSYNFDTNSIVASRATNGFLPTQYGSQATAVAGWYRLWFAFNDTSGLNSSLQFRIYPKGISGIAGTFSNIYGAQLEISSGTSASPSFYLENSSANKFTAYANYTVVGAGSGAVLVGDELRSKAVFETRVVPDASGGVGGNGYLTASNNAQSGTTTYVQLAQSDTNLASNYVGMRVFINSGTGAGQYGYISSYNPSTKIAYVLKETFDAVGITNTASSGNVLTLSSSSNTARLYVGQPIQFIPTYYTATITGTSLAQTSILSITGGIVNTILLSSTVGMYVNMPFTVSASTSTLLAGFTYYVFSINPADPVTGLFPTNTIQVTNQLFGNLWPLNSVPTVASIFMNFTSNTGYLTSNTTNMSVNLPIQFTGQAQGGLTAGTTYYIQDVIDATNFTISANLVNVTVLSTTSPSTLTVTTGTASNLTPLNPIVFSEGAGAIFGGVTEGQKYYISKILTGSTFAIATSVITATITATSSGTNLIVTSDTSQFVVNNPIIFTGTTFGNIQAETIYYIQVINSGTTFTISQTPGGGAVGLIDRTGVVTARTCPSSFTGITTVASGTMTGSSTASKRVVTVSSNSSMNATWSTTVFGNVDIGTTYYVNTINPGANQITITTVQNSGSAFTLQTKAGSMNLAAVGWDHVSPGTAPVASLDSSSSYFIEPRTTYSEPGFTQLATATTIALANPTIYTQIAYGNGYWLAVPNGNATGARSVDGNTWTQVVMPVSTNYSGVAYGNGYFVALGANGTLAAYSKSNGVGWRTANLPTNTAWSSIAYGNGKFVALGTTDTTAAYSINSGLTWTSTVLKASNTFTVSGNAQLRTAEKQFGTASLFLDGTAGTYITSPASADFGTTSSQDFAIECFVKLSGLGAAQQIFDTRTNGSEVALSLEVNASNVLRLYVNGSYVITGNTALTTAWTHIALTRSNGTTSLFVGGVLQSATYSDTNVYLARPMVIGVDYAGNTRLTGYIDEFRISKDVSRYQAGFTPPITAFSNDVNTTILLHFDGANASTNIISTVIKGNISCLTYGNGKFVALASGSSIAHYSTDGITWNSTNLPVSSTWSSVTYGNGLFVGVSNALAPSVGSLYSTDGITWYSYNLLVTADKVSYGQGVFVAVRSSSTVCYTGDGGGDWKLRTISNTAYSAMTFGYQSTSNIGIFVTLAGQGTGSRIYAGATAKGRAIITSNVITSLSQWEAGSNYVIASTGATSAPTVTFTDPNVTTLATVTARLGDGALGNPAFFNKGTGYSSNSTVITITGNGYSDSYQTGLSIILYDLTRLPQPGDNLTITGVSQIYKVTSATVMFGTTAPNIEANVQVSPEITTANSPAQDVLVSIRTKYSQVRLTGHDYLNIGFGNQIEANYPNLPTETGLQPQNQQVEVNYGRVFYTSTDQDGNFTVGGLFGVQQATGIVTLSASQFGLSGLNTLSLGGIAVGGSSVVITQFSTDGTFTANSDSILSTQRAIKTYLTARLSQGGSNTFTGQLIAGTVLVGGPNLIASSIPNGTTGSNVKVLSMMNFCGTATNPREDSLVDGAMVAQNFFYKHFFHR